ncbi:septation protein SepH [Micropruina sonneratiae]|uniref:septation protein SepH n=1 Tax=Micropruina sonneratiae TaxID=2986940 RepID=UPI002227F913|nr:septation protein SepH [Micropruina sp. KQZ13P-5]MCW3157828.1 septation protein SepH [Micropruina sp. KQZ13P-5]
MRTARPLGLSPDGRSLIVVVEGGEQVAIPADERLRAALRNDRARMGQLEIDMDSALRPRDIQARIRAGESLEAVAQAAGVPPEKIEPFAGPVLAERDHIAGLAQTNPVRRAGDAVAHRSLRTVVTERLLSRGVDADTVEWDAWRTEDRRWTVRLSYESGSAQRQADFTYDQTGRFSTAANDDARWLTGEQTTSHGPQPGRRRRVDENGDDLGLDDELAIVRAIQPQFAVTPDVDEFDDEADDNDGADNEDAYAEGDLAEVDGVYDIVPGDRSNMDVLYDMLSSFDEDSVQIYAGLVRPRPEQAAAPVLDEGPAGDDYDEPTEPTQRIEEVEITDVEADADAGPEPAAAESVPDEPEPAEDETGADLTDVPDAGPIATDDEEEEETGAEASVADPTPASDGDELPEDHPAAIEENLARDEPVAVETVIEEPAADETTALGDEAVAVELIEVEVDLADEPDAPAADETVEEPAPEPVQPKRPTGRKKTDAAPAEPEQPSLVDEAGDEPSRPVKRKRASVPSWDEIMFGAPKPKE